MDVIFPSTKCVGRHTWGFTLVELIIVLAIITVLAAVAFPGARALHADTRLSGYANTLAGHLNFARTAAIKRAQRVEVCKSSNGDDCNNAAEWHEGWIVFADNDSDRQHDDNEPLLRTWQGGDQPLTIDYGAFPSDNYVIYYPNGRSLGNGTFTLCDSDHEASPRALVLYKTGRLRSADKMPDGSPLSCP